MDFSERSGYDVARSRAIGDLRRLRHDRTMLNPVRLPLVISDWVLNALEEELLAGRDRVPSTLEPRLKALDAVLPDDLRRNLRTGVRIVRLMDQIYDIQTALLRQLVRQRSTRRAGGQALGEASAEPVAEGAETTRPVPTARPAFQL